MALLTLAEAKLEVNIAAANTDHDDELQSRVDSVSATVEDVTGPVENVTVTEVVRGGYDQLALGTVPVIALTSVQSLVTGGVSYDPTDLHVETGTGIVVRRDGLNFADGRLEVTYTAGRGGVVPPSINLAARMIVAHLWQTQRGAAGPRMSGELVSIPGIGYLIPNQAAALLEPYRTPDGVA